MRFRSFRRLRGVKIDDVLVETLSPFPGMDPFLESETLWGEFRQSLVRSVLQRICGQLPARYTARLGTYAYFLADDSGEGRAEAAEAEVAEVAQGLVYATLENIQTPFVREDYIEIVAASGRDVVTVIELMSPVMKTTEGRGQYWMKRGRLLGRRVNLVELDLSRRGERLLSSPILPAAHYYAFVSKASQRPKCDVYAWSVRHAFPKIPVPLLEPDPDVVLDLGEPFRETYRGGQYHRMIDYSAPVEPAFTGDDALFVAHLTRGAN